MRKEKLFVNPLQTPVLEVRVSEATKAPLKRLYGHIEATQVHITEYCSLNSDCCESLGIAQNKFRNNNQALAYLQRILHSTIFEEVLPPLEFICTTIGQTRVQTDVLLIVWETPKCYT
jgi:hypothetical protein